jgi:hypothetical protein
MQQKEKEEKERKKIKPSVPWQKTMNGFSVSKKSNRPWHRYF